VGRPHLWLLESVDSRVLSRIESASAAVGLSIARLDTIAAAPDNASLIGVGPSIADPLRVARQLRAAGAQALLVFFAASTAARDALQAELVRDPFVYPRFEIVELSDNPRQLAIRMDTLIAQVKRRLHAGRTRRRERSRRRVSNTAASEPMAELMRDVLQTGQSREAQVTVPGEHGLPVEARATLAPIRDARGDQLGVSVILRDDSEYQRVEAALREANRQKDELLAIMSHELRTPLTSILGYTDMLLRGLSGPLAPMTSKYVSNVRTAGDRLLELVNSLLDYTRLESGVDRLELRRVDLRPIVAQVVQACRRTAETTGIDLAVAIHDRLDTVIEADEERVTDVLRTMLGNALKFTPAGGWVRVLVEPGEDQLNSVRVSVSDSGIGLREEQLERVWERFYQADASLTRRYGGMGLGLSIARHLVVLHGGSVGAASSGPGRGSAFWFSLPRRQNI
jgi:signal transduction histidine kinase